MNPVDPQRLKARLVCNPNPLTEKVGKTCFKVCFQMGQRVPAATARCTCKTS